MSYAVTLIPGNGVGPQTCSIAQEAIARLGVSVDWDVQTPENYKALIDSVKKNGVALKAKYLDLPPIEKTPWIVRFRKDLGIHTMLRHVRNLPGLPARAEGVDIVVVREASEDIYAGFEHESTEGVFETVKVTTRTSCERISRFAFDYAVQHGRKRVTTVHKSNILKKADGMFLKVSQEVAAAYPGVQHDEVIVDALCMKLVRWPQSFDVLLCGNLFGDIVSACAAGMAGGITVAGGMNYGDGVVVFENPHGASQKVVGTDGANPYPMLGLSVDLLRHLGEPDAAERLRNACIGALQSGARTLDMGSTMGCSAVREAILQRL